MTFIFSHCTGLALIARRARAAVAADVVLACPVVEAGLGDARRATPILSPELIRDDVIFKHFSCLLVVADFLITLLLQVSLEDFFQEVRTTPPPPPQNVVCLRGWKKHGKLHLVQDEGKDEAPEQQDAASHANPEPGWPRQSKVCKQPKSRALGSTAVSVCLRTHRG